VLLKRQRFTNRKGLSKEKKGTGIIRKGEGVTPLVWERMAAAGAGEPKTADGGRRGACDRVSLSGKKRRN